MPEFLPLMVLLSIAFIIVFFIVLSKKVSDIEADFSSEVHKLNHQVSDLEEVNSMIREELLNIMLLYVEDRELLESLAVEQKILNEMQNKQDDEEKITQLLETKEKLINQVENYREELMELNTIEDAKERQKKKREISSGMKLVKEQIVEYQKLEKTIIGNIIDRKKKLVK